MNYRYYIIEYDPPPIPNRRHDWQFWHEDYDGPEDSRHGSADSCSDAMSQIDDMIEEEVDAE